jgi:hypothetical protein
MTSTSHPSHENPRLLILQAVFLFLLALAVRWLGVSSNPVHVDELYHLLAGQSWAEEGTFRMLDGEYLRGWGFTALTGYVFELFGRADLFVARLPSILGGALLVTAIFVWLSRQAGLLAGWAGALMFCFASYAIVYTQFTRFYSLQALLVWLAAITVYAALATPTLKKCLALLVFALVMFLVALHLQITTAIAMLALAVWGVIDLLSRREMRQCCGRMWRKAWAKLVVVLGVLMAAIVLAKFGGILISEFRYTPRWAEPDRNNYLYYFLEFFFSMPLLWLFLPLAAVLAIARWPRPALFCLVMTIIPVVLQSLGGMKSSRYVFYAFPFWFALWGMAVAVLLPALWRTVLEGVAGLQRATSWTIPAGMARLLAGAVMLMILGSAVIAHPIYRETAKSLRREAVAILHDPTLLTAPPPDLPWSEHSAKLQVALGHPSVLLVGDDFHAIAYLGDFDLLVNTHRTQDIGPGGEYVLDPRTGRRAISTPENIARIVECFPDGAFVVSDSRWRTYIGVSDKAADAIEHLMVPYEPAIPGFHIFKWQGSTPGSGCEEVRALATGHQRHGHER